jgi:peptide methionine sulfoxide reductase msrA/msrB
VIGSLLVSVVVFTLLLKASTLLIAIPQAFWTTFSGVVIIAVGVAIAFPEVWTRIRWVQKLSIVSNKLVGTGYQQKSYTGDMLIGLALGPVFTTCSPTYLFIIATALPASFAVGLLYLLGFTLGLGFALLCIAYFGQRIVTRVAQHMQTAGRLKQVFGMLILATGILILTGYDKRIETLILDAGYGATIHLEDQLIEKFAPKRMMHVPETDSAADVQPVHTLEQESIQPTSTVTSTSDTSTFVGKPKDSHTPAQSERYEVITLAGGCFWCTEAYFQEQQGVIDAVSGYAGGSLQSATYVQVSKGTTGHREAVQITYDPRVLSTEAILDIFWSHIDPTNTTGQFADNGFQYTSAIFYHSDAQKKVVLDSKNRLEKSTLFNRPIATKILPFTTFFKAEEYHQDYYKKASDHYERYKKASGRAGFIEETWAKDAALQFLKGVDETATSSVPTAVRGEYEYTDAEIAELLTNLDPLAYHVVAENGTESPFSNKYWDNKAQGIYVDIVTGKPLFSSTHKYDSGTGWPSFWRTIDDESVTLHEDNSLSITRTEVRSDAGHVGHVFNDGPIEQGGRRFCTNSASLLFIPREEMESKGYGAYLYLFQ